MAEMLIRIAKPIILKGFEILQLAFAVSELTKRYTTSTGFIMTWDLVLQEVVCLIKMKIFLKLV